MPDVFVSWSGGKDCSLAFHRAAAGGMKIRCLANTVSEDGQRSCSHGIRAGVIKAQAEAMGIPIMQRPTTGETYETEFIEMARTLKGQGIEGGVFGDIDFNPHREWIERVCRQAGITPHFPLWLEDQGKLLREFIAAGFEAIVVAAKTDFFGDEVLGQKIDTAFIKRLQGFSENKTVTLCGEAGEYHTLVINGPTFVKRLEVLKTEKVLRNGIHFLDILSTGLKAR